MTATKFDTAATTTPPPLYRPQTRTRYVGPRRNVFSGLSHVVLVVWAITVIFPILWTFLNTSKNNTEINLGDPFSVPGSFRLDAWGRAFSKAHIGQYMLNTVIVVTFSTVGTMLFGSMAAYVLARYKFIGNRLIYYIFVSGLAFPVFLALVPLFLVAK